MKKLIVAVLLAVLALGTFAGTAAAQGPRPPREGTGLLHEYMVAALAERLSLDVATVEAALAEGQTMYDIALGAGLTADEIPAVLQEVHQAALDAAVADGIITQEQADWMTSRMGRRMQLYGTAGTCPMGGGMGRGLRGYQNVNP